MKQVSRTYFSVFVIFIIFNFIIVSAVSALSEMEKISEFLKKSDITFTDKDLIMIEELYTFWNNYSKDLWPGMKIIETPISIVFAGKQNILIGHPKPPADAIYLSENIPLLNKKAFLYPDRTFMNGAMCSPDFEGVPTVFINTYDEYNKFIREYAKKNNLPEYENYQRPLFDHLGAILHELCHAFQFRSFANKKENKTTKNQNLSKADYPYLDEEMNLLLGLEGLILADALDESKKESLKELWQDFVTVRSERRKKLHPDLVKNEQFLEFIEGTAQYLQYALAYPTEEQMNSFKKLKAFSEFPKNIEDTAKGMVRKNLLNLWSPNMSMYMQYVYYTGVAQTHLLDSLVSNWKTDLFRKYENFDSLLFVRSLTRSADRFENIKKRYQADQILNKIRPELEKIRAKFEAAFQKHISQKGKRIYFHGIDVMPENVCIVGPCLLVEHGDYRIFEAGASQIRFNNETIGWCVDVMFKKAFPLFHQKKSGEVFFIFDGTFEPKDLIQADSVSEVSVGKWECMGNVQFDSHLFSIKCKKLEVVCSDTQIDFRILE